MKNEVLRCPRASGVVRACPHASVPPGMPVWSLLEAIDGVAVNTPAESVTVACEPNGVSPAETLGALRGQSLMAPPRSRHAGASALLPGRGEEAIR
jgi:hypothetical protein